MPNLLVINAGSTSVKYKLFTNSLDPKLFGHIENVKGEYISKLYKDGQKFKWQISQNDFAHPHRLILKEIEGQEIASIGFRIVHGGEKYTKTTKLTKSVISELEELNELAPLHNPPALKVIKQFMDEMPEIPMYGIFDTAFHNTIKPEQFIYSLPYEIYSKHKIRKYGFHGISHEYIFSQIKQLEKKHDRVISCHLGGGASISAIKSGKSYDTSMGFTPLEGLTMATRAGDIDTGVIFYLADKRHYEIKDIKELMNNNSGLLGISGITSDMRKLLELEKEGNERAHLAIEIYIYDIIRYIGMYISALNGLDVLAFSGGVGSGSDVLRDRICERLSNLNLSISKKKNKGRIDVEENLKISTRSSIPIWVIPTDEEMMIARKLLALD